MYTFLVFSLSLSLSLPLSLPPSLPLSLSLSLSPSLSHSLSVNNRTQLFMYACLILGRVCCSVFGLVSSHSQSTTLSDTSAILYSNLRFVWVYERLARRKVSLWNANEDHQSFKVLLVHYSTPSQPLLQSFWVNKIPQYYFLLINLRLIDHFGLLHYDKCSFYCCN